MDKAQGSECACAGCVRACEHTPGRFLPGEAERVAEFRGVTLQQLFEGFLRVNWWYEVSGPDTFLLQPAVVDGRTGWEAPHQRGGRCVFLSDGKCTIHPVKPFECRAYIHTDSYSAIDARSESIAQAWRQPEHQEQIRNLLKRDPEVGDGTIFSWEGGT